jgi:hexosaminidase
VPEIDVPAHTGAAVASYPELGRGDPDTAMPADSGTLDVDADVVYEFVEDVVRQVAEMTPGPYLHVGADEADDLSAAEYARFIERVLPIVEEHGKTPVGWQEVADADPSTDVVAQHWKETDRSLAGYDPVLSPRTHAYLNFRYDEETPPDGPETWGRRKFSVEESYDWDPGALLDEVDESAVLGTETALWSEELATTDDVEFMAFPRLPGVAERGWSPVSETSWEEYRRRLAAQAPRWEERGVDFYRSPQVPWPTDE